MGTSLEKAAATLVSVSIPPPDAAIERILRTSYNFSVRTLDGILLMQNMPSNEERALLSQRLQLLSGSMTHNRKAIKTLIEQMLLCFAKPIKDNEVTEEVVALFVHELGIEPAVPTWAVSQAVGNIRLGQCPEIPLWTHPRPATFAVRRAADAFAWKAKAEIVNISDVLKGRRAAPQVSPAEREKINKRFQALARELAERNKATLERDHEADAAKLAAMIGPEAFQALPNAPKRRGTVLGREATKIAAGGRR